MPLQVGQKAPDFKLPDPEKKVVSLQDFRGKNVILFFFPLAWTGACIKEMCSIQDNFKAYANFNAVAIGISVDSIFALKRFREDYKLDDIILLSDFNKDTIKAYDIVFNNFSVGYNGVAMRSTFLVDKEGNLRYIEILGAQGDQPDLEKLKTALDGLK